MKKFLWSMAILFGAATIILYFSSLNHLDRDAAKLLGVSTTINIQATVFCAACAVITAINIVGALIMTLIEAANKPIPSSHQGSASTSSTSQTKASAISNIPPMKVDRSEEERNRRILSEGGWKCSCGRVNYHYVSTCACGINKRELALKKSQEPKDV